MKITSQAVTTDISTYNHKLSAFVEDAMISTDSVIEFDLIFAESAESLRDVFVAQFIYAMPLYDYTKKMLDIAGDFDDDDDLVTTVKASIKLQKGSVKAEAAEYLLGKLKELAEKPDCPTKIALKNK